jgi:hypothetical protein
MLTYLTYIAVFAVIIVLFILLYKIFKFIISILLIGLFGIVAYLTNPSEESHKQAVLKKAEENKITLRDKKVKREDYYFFSLTGIDEQGEHRIIGAGAFTKVFVFSKP